MQTILDKAGSLLPFQPLQVGDIQSQWFPKPKIDGSCQPGNGYTSYKRPDLVAQGSKEGLGIILEQGNLLT